MLRRRQKVRYSLRTILIAFLIVELVLATVLTTWRLQQAEREIERVKAKYGVGGPNRYVMSSIGDPSGQIGDGCRSHGVRMDAPEDFALKIISYDSFTKQVSIESKQLTKDDLVYAITLNNQASRTELFFASSSSGQFFIAILSDRRPLGRFRPNTPIKAPYPPRL